VAEQKPLIWDGSKRARLPDADTIPLSAVPVMVASGASAAKGLVPVPPGTAGTTKFLREDATWETPAGGGGTTSIARTFMLMGA
jgi:hypothetical protein